MSLFIAGVLFACGDDDSADPTPSKSKTELLTQGKWKFQSGTVDPAITIGTTQITDFLQLLDECERDDILNYNADGTYAHETGAMVCDSTDSPNSVDDTGTWVFNADETKITETDGENGETNEITVISISETSLVGSVSQTFDGDSTNTEYIITVTLERAD